MKDDEDDFDPLDDQDDDDSTPDIEPVSLSHRTARPRRCWRDIERMREQREIDKLLTDQDWFDDLDTA